MLHCASSTVSLHLSSLSEAPLREPSDPGELHSLNSSSSSIPQQISSPTRSLRLNEFSDSHNSRPSPNIAPPCSATTQVQLTVQPSTPRPNGTILADINGRRRNLPKSPPGTNLTQKTQLDDITTTLEYIQISNQITPTGSVTRTPHSSTPSKEVPLKPQMDTREPEYPHQHSLTYGRPEDTDLPSTSRTTSHSLLKDSPFPPPDSSLTSWSSKDDIFDSTKKLHLGSSSPFGSSQRFRFSTTSSNSHPPPDSHISSRKSSISLRSGSSGKYNRNRPHIHEKVVRTSMTDGSMLFSLSLA